MKSAKSDKTSDKNQAGSKHNMLDIPYLPIGGGSFVLSTNEEVERHKAWTLFGKLCFKHDPEGTRQMIDNLRLSSATSDKNCQ